MIMLVLPVALLAGSFALLTQALTHPSDKRPLRARMFENLGAGFVVWAVCRAMGVGR